MDGAAREGEGVARQADKEHIPGTDIARWQSITGRGKIGWEESGGSLAEFLSDHLVLDCKLFEVAARCTNEIEECLREHGETSSIPRKLDSWQLCLWSTTRKDEWVSRSLLQSASQSRQACTFEESSKRRCIFLRQLRDACSILVRISERNCESPRSRHLKVRDGMRAHTQMIIDYR